MPKPLQRIVCALLSVEERWSALRKKPIILSGLVLVVIVAGLFIFDTAFAQGPEAPAPDTPPGLGMLDSMLLLAAAFVMALAQIVGQIVVTLLDVVAIPLMQYNGFNSSPVVAAGWSIVRDVVNMFFVVVLIIIAFGTIFGHQRFQWKQQVPKLLVFAIVINFSKTLASLIIDFGQVIMLSFANAIRDIAGGNFIQLFGLGEILSLSRKSDIIERSLTDASAQGPKAFDWFAAALVAFMMMIIVLVTMIILTVILAWRIVMLWILVTIAPLAWFVGGAKGIIQSNAYEDWWGQFKCYVSIGPVVTFFVWLTLAVAGSGTIAASEGFQTTAAGEEVNIANSLISAMEVSQLTSFIIGVAMLFAGFQAAQQTCSAVPGIARVFKPISAGALARKAAGAAAFVGARGGRLAGRGLRGGAGLAGRGLVAGLRGGARYAGVTQGASALARQAAAGVAGRGPMGLGTMVAEKITAVTGAAAARRVGDIKAAGEATAGFDSDTRVAALTETGKRGPSGFGRDKNAAMLYAAMQDDDEMAALERSGQLPGLLKDFAPELEDMKQDADMKKTITGFEKKRPDLYGTDKIQEVQSVEQARNLSAEAIANPEMNKHLDKTKVPDRKTGEDISLLEIVKRGGDARKAAAAENGDAGLMQTYTPKQLAGLPPERVLGAEGMTSEILIKLVQKQPQLATNMLASTVPGVQASLAARTAEERAAIAQAATGYNAETGEADVAKVGQVLQANPAALNDMMGLMNEGLATSIASALEGALAASVVAAMHAERGPGGEPGQLEQNVNAVFNLAQDTTIVNNNKTNIAAQQGALGAARNRAEAAKVKAEEGAAFRASVSEEKARAQAKQLFDQAEAQFTALKDQYAAIMANDDSTSAQMMKIQNQMNDAAKKMDRLKPK